MQAGKEAAAVASEKQYTEQLQAWGVYDPAFKPLIHELCIQERELRRLRKELSKAKKEAEAKGEKPPARSDERYVSIRQLQASTLASRDALGLTPKSLRKLKRDAFVDKNIALLSTSPLARIMNKHDENRKSNPPA